MKVFWQDGKTGVHADDATEMTRTQALDRWADLRGKHGNFFGLIDDQDRVLQFYFDESIPDDVDDASHLRIVRAEIPVPARKGSLGMQVTIAEARELIDRCFGSGADPEAFSQFTFEAW
ncbi:MAG: hypothetical protein SFX73_16835 [Kofleriaceae bacterium]|nr:hypothetical protein [Kofleriaceae bacterium]